MSARTSVEKARTRRRLPKLGKLSVVLALLGASLVSAQSDPYQLLRSRATAMLVLSAGAAADADVQAAINAANTSALAWWQGMNTGPARTELWNDMGALSRGSRVAASMSRLRAMAVAYAQSGASLPNGAQLLADTIAGLDWLVAKHYNPSTTYTTNWWEYEIGAPQALNDCMLALYNELGATRRASYLAAIDRFVPDPTRSLLRPTAIETGANRLDKALVVVYRGVIGQDAAKVAAGRDAISQALPYVTAGDGVYADGSFVQHGNIAYTGSYGAVAIGSLSKLLSVLEGSAWAVTDPAIANVDQWVRQAFLPVLHQGAVLDNLRGRAISRKAEELGNGRGIVRDLLALTRRSTAADAPAVLGLLKHHVQSDQRRANYFTGLTPAAITEIKALLADPTVLATPPVLQSRSYASMARGVHRRDQFLWSVAMFSPRIGSFEAGNGENPRGWYTGTGATTLLTADASQYIDGYWATVDMRRLPGVTSDGWLGTAGNFASYPNARNWVGGAALPVWGQVQGMQFDYSRLVGTEKTFSPVSGSKSWFAFGDTLIALGSAISSTGSAAVETILDNRKLINPDGSDALTLDGVAQPVGLGSDAVVGARAAYLSQPGLNTGIGYYLPELPGGPAPSLRVRRESRSGSWQDINASNPAEPLSRNYLSLALQHGVQPNGARYAYVVQPGLDANQFASYVAAPGLELLTLDANAHAAWDGRSSMGAATVWNDGVTTVNRMGQPWLCADRKSAVLLREADGQLQLALSEPTQVATGSLMLERFRPVQSVISKDAAITVLSTAPTLRLSVDLNGLQGRTLQLQAQIPASASQPANADATLRDGSYAASNFGAANTLETKNDATGYARRSLLNLPMAGLPAALRAQLRLSVSARGAASSGEIVNAVSSCSASSWSESTVNWNKQPAATQELARWNVGPAGSSQVVDITAAVQAAQAAGQASLCLLLSAPSYQGSNAWVQYRAREGGSSTAPQLNIN
ncbi:hyaluronate lyase [Paucibacter oligotrophus]|uniref:Hyaluronate lyase n=1 Tax=Roseateles oligotrophus TaxID=1769250 RepID=A0A840L633_9BURK|nr:polysaccharide lyase family 8 super-sandwich domain-containing protein [Roseateles oligotrophus]MBB4843650.1 hyaluronate lyase [Roseateles oligotrophus]